MFEEMRPIPGFPNYLIRKDGAVFNRNTGNQLKSYGVPGRSTQYFSLYQHGRRVNRSERVLHDLVYGDDKNDRKDNDGTWRVIRSFPNYEMSNHGYVRRRLTKQILTPQSSENGDMWVRLSRKGGRFKRTEQYLMEETFPEIGWNIR